MAKDKFPFGMKQPKVTKIKLKRKPKKAEEVISLPKVKKLKGP